MLLALLLACVPGRPEAYANCTVTAVTTNAEGNVQDEHTSVYDAEGRVVREHHVVPPNSLYPSGVEGRIEHTFDDEGCEVLSRGGYVAPEIVSEGEVRQECDEHGHVERIDEETRWVRGGETWESVQLEEYENVHDERGRLTTVTRRDGGEMESAWREDYEWAGACDEPAVTRYSINEFLVRETQVCRLDGRGLEGAFEAFDEEGTSVEYSRWRRDYDAAGRLVAEERDRGRATDIYQRTTYTWDDPAAPGPTELAYEGVDVKFVRYTYDCAG